MNVNLTFFFQKMVLRVLLWNRLLLCYLTVSTGVRLNISVLCKIMIGRHRKKSIIYF